MAKKFFPQVVAIYETAHWLESKGVENVLPMNKGGSQKVRSISVTMTHAVHSCGILSMTARSSHFGTFPALTGRPEQLADLIRDLDETEVLTLEPGKLVKW